MGYATYLRPDGTVYIGASPVELSDTAIPNKPDSYYEFSRESWSWIVTEEMLVKLKEFKKSQIDEKTANIRKRDGLLFDGKRFDVRPEAMIKWNGLYSLKDSLPYPIKILTLDDEDYELIDSTKLTQFVQAVLFYEMDQSSPLTLGRILRKRINDATTIEELNSIVDDRE